ncbi:Spermatogenesis-Associated Protein 31A1 [Manis pentadactyla]|nr:Spermatogenesis-Associated Protein 31A1 [Manis pentadactyla]
MTAGEGERRRQPEGPAEPASLGSSQGEGGDFQGRETTGLQLQGCPGGPNDWGSAPSELALGCWQPPPPPAPLPPPRALTATGRAVPSPLQPGRRRFYGNATRAHAFKLESAEPGLGRFYGNATRAPAVKAGVGQARLNGKAATALGPRSHPAATPPPTRNRAHGAFLLLCGPATWLSSSPTSWVTAVTAGILCGLGLLLLQFLFFPYDAPSPPPRNIRKGEEQEEEEKRSSESHLSRILDKSGDHRSRQDTPGEPYHNTEAESELKSKVKVPSQCHPRHCPPHMPLIRGNVASPVSLCRPQSRPMGEHEEGSAALGPRQAVTVSWPARVQGAVHSAGTRFPQCPPGETQGPPESSFAARLTLFLQSIKRKHQDTLPKPTVSPATAQSQGSFARRSTVENADAEAQVVMRAGGQPLEEKVAVLHGLQATELKAPVRACHHSRGQPGSPKVQKISRTPCDHQATQQGQTCPVKEKQVRRGEPLERVTFNKEQLDLSTSTSQSHKKTLSSAVSRCQGGPAVQPVPGHQRHCPRHCPLRRGV